MIGYRLMNYKNSHPYHRAHLHTMCTKYDMNAMRHSRDILFTNWISHVYIYASLFCIQRQDTIVHRLSFLLH